MSSKQTKSPLRLSPDEIGPAIPAVLGVGQAHFVSQALYAVVKLGVPDIIGSQMLTAAKIAAEIPGAPNVEMLGRSLRMLAASTGLFVEADQQGEVGFALSKAGALLQTGIEGQPSMACGVLHWLEKPMWDAWAKLPAYIAGETADVPFAAANGGPIFEYYGAHPESAKPFNEFMSFFSSGEIPIVTEMFDWSP